MKIARGELDKRIDLLRAERARDDAGDWSEGFALLGSCYAKVRPAPGAERLASAENAATAPIVFRIDWRPKYDPLSPDGLTPKDRVRYPSGTGRLFDIKSAIEIGRHDSIEIAATAAVD